MRTNAFSMQLKPGCAAEYEARHNRIWPELVAEMKAAGVQSYFIFLDEDRLTLFAFRTLRSGDTMGELRNKAIMHKWWEYMGDLMETNDDRSPVCVSLREVFRLD